MIGWTLAEDADDGVGLSVDTHRPPDNRTVAAEAVLPEPIRQDDDLVAAGCAFVLDEGAAECERMAVAEHAQESGVARPAITRSGRSAVATFTGPPPQALMSLKAVARRFHST